VVGQGEDDVTGLDDQEADEQSIEDCPELCAACGRKWEFQLLCTTKN
jgi:hypothetical protein